MSVQESGSPRKTKKPVADRHRVPVATYVKPESAHFDFEAWITESSDAALTTAQAYLSQEVARRHQRIREELEAKAAAVGAKVTFPGSFRGQRVAPKYRDEHGNTWAGRGMKPVWLKAALNDGAELDDYLIKREA